MPATGGRPLKSDSAEAAPAQRRQNNMLGAGFMVLAMFCFTGLDSVMKFLVQSHDIWALAWARSLAQLIFLTAMLPFLGARKILAAKGWGLQFARGICMAGMVVAVLLSLANMTLTQTYVAMLSAPLLAAALAGHMLSEPASARQWVFIIGGFVGVVVALDPTAPEIGWFLAYGASMAIFFSTNHILTRLGSRIERPMTQIFYGSFFSVLLLAPVMAFWYEGLPLSAWGWVAGAAAFGTAAHIFMVQALSFAPPAVVSPMIYFQVVWAALAGYVIFGEVPTLGTIIGALIVTICGIVIVRSAAR